MAASLVILNGVVWAPGRPRATALAVEGERIVAVGGDADVRSLVGPTTRVLDAAHGTILPAFNDAHVHFLMASRSLDGLDLFGAQTQEEVADRIRVFVDARHSGWLVGRGWFYSAFPGGMPSLELLDELVPDRPAYLESFDAHTAWVNSRARAVSGLGPGSGVLKEAAMLGVIRNLPPRTADLDIAAVQAGMRLAASRGIGSVQEAGDGMAQLSLYETLRERDELTMRVRLAFDMIPGLDSAGWEKRLDDYETARVRHSGSWLQTGIIKAFADGVVESRTAAMLEPYQGNSESGELLWEPDELVQAVGAADARGWQVQVHAIGDRAIRVALDAFTGCDQGHRHRVEHIETPAPADIARFAELGVIASMQPQHADSNLTSVWRRNLGAERSMRGWPWRVLLASGARLAFGTDWPVVPIDPVASLQIATEKYAAQRIGIEQAVAAWTSGAAYAEHIENEKGALQAGRLADITVLDRDVASTPGDELAETKVEATVVGGRLVYES
ncbi:MAG TPA: amidohydrolase [Candidatus Eisenbacteria bacterium]|nr:amidohydrolase [Candidatus Eisenbacteria bacterium]